MPRLITYTCPMCGAMLSPPADAVSYSCPYCRNTFNITRTVVPEAPAPTPGASPPSVQPSARRSWPSAIFFAVLVAGVALVAQRAARKSGITVDADLDKRARSLREQFDQLTSAVATRSDFLWDDVAPAVLVEGAGHEVLVGRIRSRSGTPDDQLYFVGIEGSTANERWRAGPFGTYSEAYRATFAATGGGVVAFTEHAPALHLVDGVTGVERGQVKLSDVARGVCVSDDGASAWVDVVDGQSLLVNARTLAVKPQSHAPPECRVINQSMAMRMHPSHERRSSGVALAGTRVEVALVDGELGAEVVVKRPGTPTPRAVGFDARSQRVTWQSALVLDGQTADHLLDGIVGLRAGRFLVAYSLAHDDSERLVALDARTGARLWDVPLASHESPRDLLLTDTRVFLPGFNKLTILDASDGATRRVLGF